MNGSQVFPTNQDAPLALLRLQSNCGPMSIWMILTYFGFRISVARIVKASLHSNQVGCYAIAIALALHEFGLDVVFHTDPDLDVQPLEAECYSRAIKRKLMIKPAIDLYSLRRHTRKSPAIVSYVGPNGEGHLSPVVGFYKGSFLLPYSDEVMLKLNDLQDRWSGHEFCRQCILINPRGIK